MRLKILLSCIILTSILSCQKENRVNTVKIPIGPGPEDIVYDKDNNRILASCNERRPGMPLLGEIYQLDLSTEKTSVVPRINYPNIPFFPHGFDMETIGGINYLFVINHYHDTLETSTVVQFKINAANLEFVREYRSPLIISPNDLTVLPNGSFYFSNDKSTPNILELLTNPKGGSIVYCDGNNLFKKVDSGIAYPNGLYDDGTILYVATSRNTALFKYDMEANGNLLNRRTLSTIDGMDNITLNGDDLIVSVHTSLLAFSLLSLDPSLLSPSRSFAINKNTGAAKKIFDDNGSTISGASTTLVVGDDLYLAQVFGDFLLKVENYRN